MNERNFISQAAPETGTAPGHPAVYADYDPYARERAVVDLLTRYTRLATWLSALVAALLFLAVAASVAASEFGIVSSSSDGRQELFFPRSDPADVPLEVRP